MKSISAFLWFDNQAEDAARFYVSIFKHATLGAISHYTEAGHDIHGRPAGSVMTVSFDLNGLSFTALNGGPLFQFNGAVSFVVPCDDQDEIDHYWDKLSDGGDLSAQQCGWLKDKFGLSWQIIPANLPELIGRNPPDVMNALLQMKKIDIEELKRAGR